MARFRTLITAILLTFIWVGSFLLMGCSGSEEAERDKTATPNAVITKELNDLKTANDLLRQQNEKLQQENRTLTARVAEMETQSAESHEKPAVQPPVETNTEPVKLHATTDAQSAYDDALNLYHQRQFDKALAEFQQVAESGSELSDRGRYWSGECQYALKDFNGAIESFKTVLQFDRSTKKDDAQIMLANSYLALGQKSKAKSAYEKLITNFPASPYVKSAKAKLRRL